MIVLEIHGWHTECGNCGYGSGGWAASPALKGLPVLNPDSKVCYGCGEKFTHKQDVYSWEDPEPIGE